MKSLKNYIKESQQIIESTQEDVDYWWEYCEKNNIETDEHYDAHDIENGIKRTGALLDKEEFFVDDPDVYRTIYHVGGKKCGMDEISIEIDHTSDKIVDVLVEPRHGHMN